MVEVLRQSIGNREISRWLPAIMVASVALYFVGFVDGAVQVSFLGSKMAYVHEVFHHARHVALMCHKAWSLPTANDSIAPWQSEEIRSLRLGDCGFT